jgi:polyhydroxybutyrate depolymerase
MMNSRRLGRVLAVAVLLAGVGTVSAGVIKEELTFEGRLVRLILPEHVDEGELLPLVLHLHAAIPLVLTAAPADLELNASGYDNIPSKYKVIVAAPTATAHPALPIYFWNATEACCGFESVFGEQVDDAGFLIRLVDELLATRSIDPKRVYIYGYSNGGFMAHRMACDHADRFAAVVSGAGATFKDPERCAPSAPISVLEVHSRDDDNVLFDGGFAPEVPPSPETEYPGAIETIEQWGHINGCKGKLRFGKRPVFDLADDTGIEGVEGKETTINRITRCRHGIDVELWSMEGVPHPPLFFVVGQNGMKTLAEKTWKFLHKHVRDDNDEREKRSLLRGRWHSN